MFSEQEEFWWLVLVDLSHMQCKSRIDSGTGKTMFTEVSAAQATADIAQPCRGHGEKRACNGHFPAQHCDLMLIGEEGYDEKTITPNSESYMRRRFLVSALAFRKLKIKFKALKDGSYIKLPAGGFDLFILSL